MKKRVAFDHIVTEEFRWTLSADGKTFVRVLMRATAVHHEASVNWLIKSLNN